jgi:hypothetical protein
VSGADPPNLSIYIVPIKVDWQAFFRIPVSVVISVAFASLLFYHGKVYAMEDSTDTLGRVVYLIWKFLFFFIFLFPPMVPGHSVDSSSCKGKRCQTPFW